MCSITVSIDDTLFRRWGRKVHAAFWTHDGADQGKHKIGRGNRWVMAGIVVRLPFCSSPVCLPVLFRLWQGKGTASHVDLAAEMIAALVRALPTYRIHGVGDAAYHGKALAAPAGEIPTDAAPHLGKAHTTWTTRLPHNATLYAPAPPPTGRPGRPRLKGDKLGKPEDLAASATWRTVTVNRYGDLDTSKQQMGVGQARNRLPRAVERTVPFGMLVQSLVVVWYATAGYHPDDITARREAEPWYPGKSEPSFEDMIVKLRKTLIVARFSGPCPAQPDPQILRDYELACTAAAA
ncbi:MAG: transposase [Micromonosporaceae bacterium]|nr:transposase [Micromonosporaceae bacterium]